MEKMERGAKEREEKERDANERGEKERNANEQEEKKIYVNKNDDQEVFYLKELENIGKTYYIVLNNIYQKHYIKYHDYDIYFIFNSDSDVIQSYVRCHCNRDSCLRDASGSNHTCVGITVIQITKYFLFVFIQIL